MKPQPSLSITPPPENPSEADKLALQVIYQLSKIMARKSTIDTIHRQIILHDDSVRRIQGGRFEVFVSDATDKQSKCFDQIVTRDKSYLPHGTKEILLGYATRQAQQHPDISKYGPLYKFVNFSLLVNGRNAQEQPHHIDMITPNSQFGLLLTSNSPPTLVFHVDETVETMYDIQRIWDKWNGPNIPFLQNLIIAFESSKQAQRLVRHFGNILIPEVDQEQQPTDEDLPPGSLMMLPGGVIHAGPQSQKGRTVLFFSGCPILNSNDNNGKQQHDNDDKQQQQQQQQTDEFEQAYHPDTQYSALFLCGQLVDLLWQAPKVGQPERYYLLQMLVKYQRQSPVERKMASHFPEGGVKCFITQLEDNNELRDTEKLQEFIRKTSRENAFCHYNIQGDFENVSIEGLLTKWEGTELEVVVYRRVYDDKIILHYPKITEGAWEGSNPGDMYTLRLNTDAKLPYDGSNGSLVDNDGAVISCYIRRRRGRKKTLSKKKPRILK